MRPTLVAPGIAPTLATGRERQHAVARRGAEFLGLGLAAGAGFTGFEEGGAGCEEDESGEGDEDGEAHFRLLGIIVIGGGWLQGMEGGRQEERGIGIFRK